MTNNDALGDCLIEKGFVASRYVLDLNHGLMVPVDMDLPAPWNLPSRLFRFPIAVSEPDDNGVRRIELIHPLLGEHPFVQCVAAELGVSLNPDGAPNEYGVGKQGTAIWWHAVDLVTAGNWRELIETRRFTTDDDIARAVAYGLSHSPANGESGRGYLTAKDARALLNANGSVEPTDRLGLLHYFAPPLLCRQDSGRDRWPINETVSMDAASAAWGRVLGIECGWFAYDRAGFLVWKAKGRDLFAAGPNSTFIEVATGQGAFAF